VREQCAVVTKDTIPPASARYDHTSIDRAPSTLQTIVLKRSHAKPLNLEDLSNDTLPTLSPTRATLLNIFGVVGRNDVLARLGVVHDGLGVREKSIEAPVEDAGGNEGVDIADIEKVLTAQRDAGLAIAGYNDVVDEAGEWGDAADEEGDDGAPVASVSGRVAVDTVEVVHVGYGHVTASDNIVVGHENGCHGTQENSVAAEESKELCG